MSSIRHHEAGAPVAPNLSDGVDRVVYADRPSAGGFELTHASRDLSRELRRHLERIAGIVPGTVLWEPAWRCCPIGPNNWAVLSYEPLAGARAGSITTVILLSSLDSLPPAALDPVASITRERAAGVIDQVPAAGPSWLPLDRAAALADLARTPKEARRDLVHALLVAGSGGAATVRSLASPADAVRFLAAITPLRILVDIDVATAPDLGSRRDDAGQILPAREGDAPPEGGPGARLLLALVEECGPGLALALDELDGQRAAPSAADLPYIALGLCLHAGDEPRVPVEPEVLIRVLEARGLPDATVERAAAACLSPVAAAAMADGAEELARLLSGLREHPRFAKVLAQAAGRMSRLIDMNLRQSARGPRADDALVGLVRELEHVAKSVRELAPLLEQLRERLDEARPQLDLEGLREWLSTLEESRRSGAGLPRLSAYLEAQAWTLGDVRLLKRARRVCRPPRKMPRKFRDHIVRVLEDLVSLGAGGLERMGKQERLLRRDPPTWRKALVALSRESGSDAAALAAELARHARTDWDIGDLGRFYDRVGEELLAGFESEGGGKSGAPAAAGELFAHLMSRGPRGRAAALEFLGGLIPKERRAGTSRALAAQVVRDYVLHGERSWRPSVVQLAAAAAVMGLVLGLGTGAGWMLRGGGGVEAREPDTEPARSSGRGTSLESVQPARGLDASDKAPLEDTDSTPTPPAELDVEDSADVQGPTPRTALEDNPTDDQEPDDDSDG